MIWFKEKKMNFTAYIERQKNIIRSRHEGEVLLMEKDEVVASSRTEILLYELTELKGLNKRERLSFNRKAV